MSQAMEDAYVTSCLLESLQHCIDKLEVRPAGCSSSGVNVDTLRIAVATAVASAPLSKDHSKDLDNLPYFTNEEAPVIHYNDCIINLE